MTESEQRSALAREDVCRYLAACYYQPEKAFEQEGVFESLLNAATLVHSELVPLAKSLGEQFKAADPEALLLDYTRLFLGPSHILAKPYGSVWLDEEKTLMGDSTMAVLALYREGGFDIDDAFMEVPDHIAVELEFLYLLIYRENEARLKGESGRLIAITDMQKRFLTAHLGRWIEPFSDVVVESAESLFYRQLAEMTRMFVNMELERVNPQVGKF